ncbi:hypothetical protein EV426DRAFT_608312 [Tirmania nivea]|nr:hypothetical protein EV426DRAFT_608312 [Tirmania nivea]
MPLSSKRGISTRPQAKQQLSSALPSTQDPTVRQQETESQLLREQKIPNPLPPLPFGRQNTRTSRLPLSLPDYEHDNKVKDGMRDEDIIVYGSDEQAELGQDDEAEIEKFKDERLKRVHTYAERYLAGDRVYIHCARLKGPVVNNPWKKRKGYNDHEKMPSGMREFKRRRLMVEEDEVMATPTQRAKAMRIEAVENQKSGPRRKQAARKQVVHEEEDDEEEEEEDKEEEKELDTISVTRGVQKELHTITVAATSQRKTTATGKSNLRTTRMSTPKIKPKSRTRTSRNSSKASTTTTASKKIATTSKGRKVEPLHEEIIGETTVAVKSKRGRGEWREGRGGRISTKPKATITQHVDDREDEGEFSSTTSMRRSKRKAPSSVDKAKRGNHGSRTVSGETTSKAKKAQPKSVDLELKSDYAAEPAMGQPLEAAAAATTNFWEEPFEMPAVENSAEPRGNHPAEPITPIANLSLEEPTPPSIFYGPSSTSINGSANLANRFIAIKQGTFDPVAKQSNSKDRTIPTAETKPKRAGSAPAAAAKKNTGKTADETSAISVANGKRRQKATTAIPEKEGDSRKRRKGEDDVQNDWISASSDFRYKKGNSEKAAVVGAKGGVLIDNGKDGNEESINKGKGRAKEATATQQPKRKKPRVIDFAALSPFGGGKVVTKGGGTYSSSGGGQEDERKGANKPRADRNNIVGRLQSGNNVSVATMAPSSSNIPPGKPKSGEKGDSPLSEIPCNTNSQENINKLPVAVNQKAFAAKESTQVAPIPGQPSEVRGSLTLSKEVDEAAQAAECTTSTTSTTIHGKAPSVPALDTPGGEPQPTELSPQIAFTVPPPPAAGLESQSPWMNTQRQLSAARKGFMSLLDTPIAEETTPAKLPSAALSRLRRGPDFGLQRGVRTMETPSGNALSIMPPGSIVLMPETPAPILAALDPDPTVEGEASSGAGVVPDTSPPGPTASRHHGESTTTPTALSAFRTRNGADVTFSSPMAVRVDIIGESHGEGTTQRNSIKNIPPPEFSPFKTFDTPTKSQFGSFMQGFSPLRYSPDGALGTIEEPQSQSTSQPRPQSQSSMVPIRLFGGDKPKSSRDLADKPENQQRVNPSAWLGSSQSQTSNISFFNSSVETPAQRPAPPSSPALPPSPPPRSPQARTPPPVLPPPPFSPSEEQAPGTPRFRRISSTQFTQNGQQSPGTKLAGDMLEMMGGGVWDIDAELNKMRSEDAQVETEGSSKNALVTPATGRGKLGKELFSSGTRRVRSGKRRW